MKPIYFSPLITLLLLAPFGANAAGSALRVTCDELFTGGEVYVNDKLRGECPVDLQGVPAGPVALRVVKQLDATHERVFKQEFRMFEDSVKRVEASFAADWRSGSWRLNAEGKRQEQIKFKAALKAAQAGDTDAMATVAAFYSSAETVPENYEQAVFWNRKAAAAGNAKAMMQLASAYEHGKGLTQSGVDAEQWMRKSADLGNAGAMFFMGAYYMKGIGVAESKEQAVYWWRKGAAGSAPENDWSIDQLKRLGLR